MNEKEKIFGYFCKYRICTWPRRFDFKTKSKLDDHHEKIHNASEEKLID